MTELADAVASRLGREAGSKVVPSSAVLIPPYHMQTKGFQPLPGLQQLLLREPLARGERSTLSPGPLSEEEALRVMTSAS